MARYEGMDELLQRVQERLVSNGPALERPQPDMRRPGTVPPALDFYDDMVEQIVCIRSHARALYEELDSGAELSLNQAQCDDLLRRIRETLQDLWGCESVLDRVVFE